MSILILILIPVSWMVFLEWLVGFSVASLGGNDCCDAGFVGEGEDVAVDFIA